VRTEPLERELVDPDALELTHERFHEAGIALPTVAQLADPELVPPVGACRSRPGRRASPQPLPVHWHNGANRVDLVDVPGHIVLSREPTGADARIVLTLGLSRKGRDEASRDEDAPQVLEIAATRRKP
jgi:hypothetical protein